VVGAVNVHGAPFVERRPHLRRLAGRGRSRGAEMFVVERALQSGKALHEFSRFIILD
jgi:hypothetical protein